jgi:ABC-type transport system involved in multi-copper enzyme maturation permease subunit
MTLSAVTPHRLPVTPERESFWHLVRAEWTKFRTVRGWVIAVLFTMVAIPAFAFISTGSSSSCGGNFAGSSVLAGCAAQPTGPGGVPVVDAFYFAHQPVTANGTITVQVTSLTGQSINGANQLVPAGLDPWSKTGIIIKENTSPGSAYAAMMVTGSNGVRMQWDYVNDTPGPGQGAGEAGGVSASAPRWLRLVRAGSTITGYDSADGTHWTLVGTATLPGLTSTVQAGLFAAGSSYDSGFDTMATGGFRHIGLSWPATGWTGTNVGGPNGVPVPGTLRQSAGALTVAGFGDISPAAGNAYSGSGQSLQRALAGTFFALIPLIVVAAMVITAEYRRGLIHVSLTAAPRRGRLLAAKAVVIGAVGFAAGLVAATLALAVGTHLLHGNLQWPVSLLTEARMVVGTAALLAVAAVLALAIGTIVRSSAVAVGIVIVVIFVPYLLVRNPLSGGGGGGAGWALQVTPAAALSVQQAVPQFYQLIASYTPAEGYYPLGAWTGLAVECAWAVAALALAFFLLRRRDA